MKKIWNDNAPRGLRTVSAVSSARFDNSFAMVIIFFRFGYQFFLPFPIPSPPSLPPGGSGGAGERCFR